MLHKAKVLTLDIETSPIEGYVWGLFDQNIGLNQIKKDWFILAWAAKWLDDPASKVIYRDGSKAKDMSNDKPLLVELSELINQADVIISQNGDRFDFKKIRARAVIHKLPPIRRCKSTDMLKETRKVFGFTSHKLEYMTGVLNTKYKKLSHKKYPGFELWKAVLANNSDAWTEMRKYCIHDVLSTDELYSNLQGWITTHNEANYYDDLKLRCFCGSADLASKEIRRQASGEYQGYICRDCGKRLQSKQNLLSLEKRKSLLKEGK